MHAAIIAALVTLVVAAVVVVALFVVRSNAKSSNVSVRKNVRSITSVGVSSSLSDSQGRSASAHAQAGTEQRSVGSLPDGLKSRFAAMGVLAAGIFGTLATKSWIMQVFESEEFNNAADANRFATVSTPAPRGFICDANGVPLVKNRVSHTVMADPDVADDHDVVQRLSAVLGVPYNVVRQRIQDASGGAQSQRVVAGDVRLRDVAFISEHSDAFKGVDIQQRSVREYPYGALAAHALGYTGTVTEDALKSVPEGRTVELSDQVGLSGVEQTYDNYLAGEHGRRKVVADADGNVVEVDRKSVV